jgi:TonB family protein
MRSAKARPLAVALLVALCGAASLCAQEEVLTAGGEGVPVPKKTKHVQPSYPAEALAQGIRGIVILDIVVDGRGKVASTSVLRSVAGLDEAAIAAARQWEYEPTKVDGKPVSVRLTVPITFSLALPRLMRQAGVPELRQGVAPGFPPGDAGGRTASAEVTLEPDGRIADATLLSGEPPWSEALLTALRTWRFTPPPDDAVVSFRVEAEFVKGRGSEPNSVLLKANGLQRSELLAGAGAPLPPPSAPQSAPPPAAVPQAPAAPVQTSPAQPQQAVPAAPVTAPETPEVERSPQAQPAPPAPATTVPPAAGAQAPAAGQAPAAAPPSATPPAGTAPGTTPPEPPPVEVITAPAPAPPPESGVSAIRDVTLEPGVPDLARGRRPVAPPFARMSGTTGSVEVSFSVSAGGTTALQTATGPDLLRYSAEQTVASWLFRRSRADRAYLVAVFSYGGDKATAVVRPQVAPAAAVPAEAPAPVPASSIPPSSPPSIPPSTMPPTPPPAATVPPPASK